MLDMFLHQLAVSQRALLLAAATASVLTAGDAHAALVFDQSPATTGATVLTNGLDNRSYTQNFAELFAVDADTELTGMSIYMSTGTATLGDIVTIRLWTDAPGVPSSLVTSFTEPVTAIDSDGAVTGNERVHADFTTPVAVDGGTHYWIGMSGSASTVNFHDLTGLDSVDDSRMAQFTDATFGFLSGTATGDMAFRLEGDAASVPALSMPMLAGLAAGLALLGGAAAHGVRSRRGDGAPTSLPSP